MAARLMNNWKWYLSVLYLGMTISCGTTSDDEWHHIKGPDDMHSLVLFFNKGVSSDEISGFVMNVLETPRSDGRGSDHAAGESELTYINHSGYEGYAIDFSRNATLEQRADLKSRIAASPVVFELFEYAGPNQIVLPGDKELSRKGFPALWFTPVDDPNKPDWEILPQEAKAGEVILSKRNELGILSNFAATPFVLDGKRYASVEGFWQMMLYPEGTSDERASDKSPPSDVKWKFTREQVAQMTAFEAKSAGTLAEENMKKLGIDWCTYQGKRFPYRSATPGEHYRLIIAAMRAKLEQNPEVRRILLATGDLILKPDHHTEENPPPEWKYYEIWMQLRKELAADK